MKPRVPASKYKKFIEFVELLRSRNALSYFEMAANFTFYGDDRFWISGAFLWFDTNEGYGFWKNLNIEWSHKLQREQNK